MIAADHSARDAEAKRFADVKVQDILAAFLLIAFMNGEYFRICLSVQKLGLVEAIYATFGISVVIWCAFWVLISLVRQSEIEALSQRDILVLVAAAVFILVPVSALTWLGLTGVALYFLATCPARSTFHHAMWILLALSVSNFWSKLVFKMFLDIILRFDTVLVSYLTNTASNGNLIYAADGKTTLQVLEACTSFDNLSLAFLGWIVARGYFLTSGWGRGFAFISMSCFAVITINTIRIGIIALWPETYDIAHGPIGANIANLLTSASVAAISIKGARPQ